MSAARRKLSPIVKLGIGVYALLAPVAVLAPPTAREKVIASLVYLALPIAFWAIRRASEPAATAPEREAGASFEDADLWPLEPIDPQVEATLLAGLRRSPPKAGVFWQSPLWPVSCGELMELVETSPNLATDWDDVTLSPAEARDDWKSELASLRAGGDAENGVNLFRCAKCGARAGVYSHT